MCPAPSNQTRPLAPLHLERLGNRRRSVVVRGGEIQDLHAAGGCDRDGRRAQIAVNDAALVSVTEAAREQERYRRGDVRRELLGVRA